MSPHPLSRFLHTGQRSGRGRLLPLVLLAPALSFSCGGADRGPAPADEPLPPRTPWTQPIHVVVSRIDGLRADHLSLYGYARPTSPHLEALAAESVVFEQASACAPSPLPSIASLLVSSFPPTHGVLSEQDRLAEDAVTIAERLTELGYRTRSAARDPLAGPMCGLDRGFGRATRADRVVGAQDVEQAFAEDDPRPLFLDLRNTLPHEPYGPDPRFLGRFGARSHLEGAERIRLLYDAKVAEADEEVGRTVATLKRLGVWDDTLFVLLSDHGEEMGERGGWGGGPSLYGELVHVPLLIHFPGGAFAGEQIAEPVSLLSVAPTILEAVGIPPWSEPFGEGWSLFDLLWPGPPAAGARVVSVGLPPRKADAPRSGQSIALRDGMWKGIWNEGPDTFELYDLASDPGETRNLFASELERSGAFLEAARAWHEEHPPPPETSPGTDAAADTDER